ncbi:zinc-binding dehydrogenase [Rhizorhabdus sp. FW153]|uniref:zinc-binding dehydrogenase n=1 Tax=Rhizorhabdus sp. FW153 TaxID=3400216 RepID=UPI003CED9475
MLEPAEMRAVRVLGGPGSAALRVQPWPVPSPRAGEMLVAVRASGLNHADLYQRDGEWPAPEGASDTLGVEVAGTVISADPTGRFAEGARVMALVDGGGYAEIAAVDPALAVEIPPHVTFQEAAALPEALIVAHGNLVDIGAVEAGMRVLIHGGASGMGSVMIQIARDLGAEVVATTSDPAKIDRLKALGACHVVDRNGAAFQGEAGGAAPITGFDLIVDMAGASTLSANLERLNHRGTLILMGIMGGMIGTVDVDPIILKRLTVRGTILRSLPTAEKRALAARAFARWIGRVAAGAIRPVIDSIHPFEAVRAAHDRLEQGGHFGKIVLAIDPESTNRNALREFA